jgi:uncharacterized lipoprotein YddW (UPF0748 family)
MMSDETLRILKTILWMIIIGLCAGNVNSLDSPPKREFRGVWVATVVNLDWPYSPTQSVSNQKRDLINLFDALQKSGFNAIVFQVRDECDAFYNSSYDPWSYYLTGQQGKAPNPYYDPLQFAIEEAHKRNMELHAWLNPYRAEVSIGHHTMASSHVTVQHPDWVYVSETRKLLDPGLPQVRDYITNVIRDIVEHYDVDAIHFDDYFYPYDPITDQDAETFANYSRGFTDIGDWRRDNVNILVEQIYYAIQDINPRVKFGISPFGIWKSGVPPGVTGFSSYSGIYCDPLAWIEAKTIDYLGPQCYWEIGGAQDYNKLVPWWADQVQDRHLYPGHAGYKAGGWAADELPNQIRTNRDLENCQGSIFFRTMNGVLNNPKGFRDSLMTNFYRYPALMPIMPWIDDLPPNQPRELAFETMLPQNVQALTWYAPAAAADGDSAWRYVLYRMPADNFDSLTFAMPGNIMHIQDSTYWIPIDVEDFDQYAYAVTALDRLTNESALSNILLIDPQSFRGREEAPLVNHFILRQNYPNPFNAQTRIEFTLRKTSRVQITIYNAIGQQVCALVDQIYAPGTQSTIWDGRDQQGNSVSSGVYLYVMQVDSHISSKKMILIR